MTSSPVRAATCKAAALLHALLLVACAAQQAPATKRSNTTPRAFQQAHPCPSTHQAKGTCPGWQRDHIKPLCAGGPDTIDNMQWLTIEQHRTKTKTDLAACRSPTR